MQVPNEVLLMLLIVLPVVLVVTSIFILTISEVTKVPSIYRLKNRGKNYDENI